jgi:hypothetical protein
MGHMMNHVLATYLRIGNDSAGLRCTSVPCLT